MRTTRTTLASLVDDWRRLGAETAFALHRGNRTFRTSYGELAVLAGRFASDLERRGIGVGERVVLWGENSPAWVAAFFGCLLRGALVVPLDSAGNAAFADRVVREVSPRLVVGDVALLSQVGNAVPQLVLDGMEGALPAEPAFALAGAVTEDTPFQIVFTSGTTSEPKGVVHTHRNVLASVRPIETEIGKYRRYERWFHPLRFLHTLPFSHVFGQFMGLWLPAVLGAEVHLPADLDAGRLMALVKRERISVLVAVPRVLDLLRDRVRRQDPSLDARLAEARHLSAWQRWWAFRRVHRAFGLKFWAFICGGATLPSDLEAFWNGLGFALVQGYGMTETAALVTLNHPFKVGKGTLGKTLPGREVQLSPEGEILVRGDVLATGTWRNGRYEARQGEWLATGDLAARGPDGELRFTGRRGDVIVTAAGLNVYPADVEAAVLRQPGVRACAVVECAAGDGPGPVGVVLPSALDVDVRGVMTQANRELAPHQQMRYLLRWPETQFPYTSTGKLVRRRIAAWACLQVGGGRSPEPGMGVLGQKDPLLEAVESVTRQAAQNTEDGSRLTEDLHLDSLGRVQLQSVLEERFGVEISDDALGSAQTLGELRRLAWPGAPPQDAGAPAAGSLVGRSLPGGDEAQPLRYPRWPWSPVMSWARAVFLRGIALPLVWLLARPEVVVEDAPVEDGPMLLVSNHVNTFDLPLVLYAVRKRRGRVATAMSAEVLADLRGGRKQGNFLANLLGRPAYWLLLGLFNVFPLPRLSGFRASFAHAGEALDRGYCVLVFPEGRRGWTGTLQPFRPGVGLLVQASQVAVLPMALQGMGTGTRRGRSWWRTPRVRVHLGRPLRFARDTPPEEIARQLEAAVRALHPS